MVRADALMKKGMKQKASIGGRTALSGARFQNETPKFAPGDWQRNRTAGRANPRRRD
jgi:hypothetical protein